MKTIFINGAIRMTLYETFAFGFDTVVEIKGLHEKGIFDNEKGIDRKSSGIMTSDAVCQ